MSQPPRTNQDDVVAILGDDYDSHPEEGPPRDLTPYINTASIIVDQVNACEIARGYPPMDAERAELMEAWLAAYFYTKSDPVYSSRTTAKASGTFVRDKEIPEPYKGGALDLDFYGCLSAILNKKRARMTWLGKPPSAQIPYDERS
jgi:hypothetical protein